MATPNWTQLSEVIGGVETYPHRVVTFYAARTSPFTQKVSVPTNNDSHCMTKTEVLYYLDVVATNLASLSSNELVPWEYLQTATMYYNVQKSGTFTRTNCGTAYTGGSGTYIVAAGTYYNTTSQASVDTLAQNDVDTNGQAWVNAGGASCNLRPTAWRGISPFCVTNDTTTTGTLNWALTTDFGNLFTITGGSSSVSTSLISSGSITLTSGHLIQIKLATPVYNPLDTENGLYLVVAGTGLSYDRIIYIWEADFVAFCFSYNPSMGTIYVTAGVGTY